MNGDRTPVTVIDLVEMVTRACFDLAAAEAARAVDDGATPAEVREAIGRARDWYLRETLASARWALEHPGLAWQLHEIEGDG